jgi:membrane fusion protein, multidrug efflux system
VRQLVENDQQIIDDPKQYEGPKPGWLFTLGIIIAMLMALALTTGLVLGHDLIITHQTSQLAEHAQQGRNVLVAKVLVQESTRSIDLPATIHGYIEAAIYAKVAGYMKTMNVDKGDRVKEGQVLATLESPELDQQVAVAKANYWLQLVTDRREQMLLRASVIPQQQADISHTTMLQARATYEQLRAEQNYEEIRAPFDGIVTARYVDPGALIPQSTTPTNGTPIIGLATLSPLRIYAQVPQSVALFIKNGDEATVTTYELSGKKFTGTIVRHPEAIDTASRTMLVEMDLPNRDRVLLPGMYARLAITVTSVQSGAMVRDDALVFRDGKVWVPVVRNNRLHLVAVKLGYDNGEMVVVDGDVNDNDLIALNVGQSASDGDLVHAVYGQN